MVHPCTKIVAATGLALATVGSLISPASAATVEIPPGTPYSLQKQLIFDGINADRAALRTPPLTTNVKLTAVAQKWAQIAATRTTTTHTPPLDLEQGYFQEALATGCTVAGGSLTVVDGGPTPTENGALTGLDALRSMKTTGSYPYSISWMSTDIGVGVYSARKTVAGRDFWLTAYSILPMRCDSPSPTPPPGWTNPTDLPRSASFLDGMEVRGAIGASWMSRRLYEVGAPVTNEQQVPGGLVQHFEIGSITWSPTTGARMTIGAIRDAWSAQARTPGSLGVATTEEIRLRRGAFQAFQNGSIYWSPATGAQIVKGAIRDAWGRQGWEGGRLGYPTSGEYRVAGQVRQNFQGGILAWDGRTAVTL